MIVRYGYSEHIVTKDLTSLIYNRLRDFISPTAEKSPKVSPAVASSSADATSLDSSSEIEALERAFQTQVLYIVGKEQLKTADPDRDFYKGFFRRLVLNAFIWIRDLTRSKVQEMNVPVDHLVEVGFIKEM